VFPTNKYKGIVKTGQTKDYKISISACPQIIIIKELEQRLIGSETG
jgi:hypothetical protein